MANKTMNVVLNMVKCVPKGEGKRAEEQYCDQCFDKWMFEIHFACLSYFSQSSLRHKLR